MFKSGKKNEIKNNYQDVPVKKEQPKRKEGVRMTVQPGEIPVGFQDLLNMLRKQEGGKLHFNAGEKDITNGYGIYRYAHPAASIWKYYDDIAISLDIKIPSYNWSMENILAVQSRINANEELWLSYLFYKDYLAPVCLDQCHPLLVKPIASIYTNGVKLCVRAMQRALIYLYKDRLRDATFPADFAVDGLMGPGTRDWFLKVSSLPEADIAEYKNLFLSCCKYEYKKLADSNPDKFGRFLKGWYNRVDSLI